MGLMMNPTPVSNDPLGVCKQSHTDEDAARYGKTMGPMLSMMTPNYRASPNAYMNMMNPNTYMGMMAPVMDPDTYRKWIDAWMKKYGAASGAASGAKK